MTIAATLPSRGRWSGGVWVVPYPHEGRVYDVAPDGRDVECIGTLRREERPADAWMHGPVLIRPVRWIVLLHEEWAARRGVPPVHTVATRAMLASLLQRLAVRGAH